MFLQSSIAQLLLIVGLASASAIPVADSSNAAALDKRQSTNWVWNCGGESITPGDFKAFNLGGCNAQLTFTRSRNWVGVMWEFDAVYSDGSRRRLSPYRNFDSFAISDPFYCASTGNNWISSSKQSRAYTSVHEISNVCNNGAFPTSFIFYTSSNNGPSCQPNGYRYTSSRITPQTGTRPAAATYSARRVNSAGEFEITWSTVSGAAAYAVIFQTPTGSDEVGNPYTNIFGAKVSAPNTRVTLAGVNGQRWEGRNRQVAINVVNSEGVWSDTRNTVIVQAPW